jgi:large subunit ribosomal protein L15
MPIHRRLPKRGFTNIFKKEIAIINVGDLARFDAGAVVDEATLVQSGLVKGARDGIKLLGNGAIDIALTVQINAVSRSAKEKIEAAGGTVEVI